MPSMLGSPGDAGPRSLAGKAPGVHPPVEGGRVGARATVGPAHQTTIKSRVVFDSRSAARLRHQHVVDGARVSRPPGPEARYGRPATGPQLFKRAGRPRSRIRVRCTSLREALVRTPMDSRLRGNDAIDTDGAVAPPSFPRRRESIRPIRTRMRTPGEGAACLVVPRRSLPTRAPRRCCPGSPPAVAKRWPCRHRGPGARAGTASVGHRGRCPPRSTR